MGTVKFKISPWFILLAFMFAFYNKGVLFFSYFLTLIYHELAHSIVAGKLNYNLNKIKLMPYGAKLCGASNFRCSSDEIKIALAGPVANLILVIIMFALCWIFPVLYPFLKPIINANAVTFIYNLLPIYPLDGGRVLNALLAKRINKSNVKKIHMIITIFVVAVFLSFFIVSCFSVFNINFLLISIFLISNMFEKDDSLYYSFMVNGNVDITHLKKGVEIENLAISSSCSLLDLCKLLNNNKIVVFHVFNDKNIKIAQINGLFINKLIEKYGFYCSVKEIIEKKVL